MNALGRARVKAGVNFSHSMSTTVTVGSPERMARSSAASVEVGDIVTRPRLRRCASVSPTVAMPLSAHGPQETEVATSPRARRDSARPSRNALAAE